MNEKSFFVVYLVNWRIKRLYLDERKRIMNSPTVTEALQTRKSIRAFSRQPVELSVVQEVLELAALSPSGGNVQPWKVDVLTGNALRELAQKVQIAVQSSGGKTEPEFPTYPENMVVPYNNRRKDCGEVMYEALNIPREDKMQRMMQTLRNFEFFGAPVGIIITAHQQMGMPQAMDIGIFMQSIMLLASERGLDTCPQVSWSIFPQPVKEYLGLGDDRKVMAGMCLGYKNNDEAVNNISQPRATLNEFASFHGF